MTDSTQRPPPFFSAATALSIVAAALAAAVAALLLAAWAWQGPGDAEVSPEHLRVRRFVAFSFAVMGAVWLLGVFLFAGKIKDVPFFSWAGAFRWAAAVDVCGVALVVAAALSGAAPWTAGLKLYAILACFAVLQLGIVRVVARPGGRVGPALGLAVAAAVLACSTLLWGHLPARLAETGGLADKLILAAVRYLNPLLAANDAINPPLRFDWPHFGRMYHDYGIVGEARAWPLPAWSIACLVYLTLAAWCFAISARISRGSRPSPGAASSPLG